MAFYRRRTTLEARKKTLSIMNIKKSSAFAPHADESRKNLLEIFALHTTRQSMTLNAN